MRQESARDTERVEKVLHFLTRGDGSSPRRGSRLKRRRRIASRVMAGLSGGKQ